MTKISPPPQYKDWASFYRKEVKDVLARHPKAEIIEYKSYFPMESAANQKYKVSEIKAALFDELCEAFKDFDKVTDYGPELYEEIENFRYQLARYGIVNYSGRARL